MADEKRTEHPEDTTSDPAESDAPTDGRASDQADWSSEGGATSDGPATETEE